MKVLRRKTVFKGKLLSIVEKEVENTDGSTWVREVVTYGGNASVVVPFYEGNFIFVKQFRPTLEDFILEFPAGRIEDKESPIECARRELEEETGFIPKNLTFVYEFYPSPGFVDEKLYLFYADSFEIGLINLDEGEEVNYLLVPKSETFNLLDKGKIIDGKTIVGLLWFRNKFGE
ncbi:NUDIX hydrolase [Caldisericum exile]|uniref:GDP-mannose pyrophosphatase n=1 Tax=Caldisericum exile (strain DSM 21853 / NBRC 104410 / AZM16c01) TaxID=511051 RepID=A0A7U6GFA8_CALEA|nr:NUDIX hydrolase [Caldisericum exile]BAL81281.1 ADP-ribose pyrophosphatase [Caldisericum exile AZM16c01]